MRLKKWVCVVVSLLSLSPLAAQQVVSTHSVSVELAGLMYAYECPMGEKFSLVARVGTQAGIQYSSHSSFWGEREHRWSVGLYPVLSVEPRYYYNLSNATRPGRMRSGTVVPFSRAICNMISRPIIAIRSRARAVLW